MLKGADDLLAYMETEVGEPTNDNMEHLISSLLAATNLLTTAFAQSNNETIQKIYNTTAAILPLSQSKCNQDTNPNPTDLFEQMNEIFEAINVLFGLRINEKKVYKHLLGTTYLKRTLPSDISDEVLGSEKDGEMIILPEFSVLEAQVARYSTVTAQMSTFNRNPHRTNTSISENVCSLSLMDGNTNIRLVNLTKMIEIFMPRPPGLPLQNSTIKLEKDTVAVTTFNISDPLMTAFVSIEPNENVSLILRLAHGSPPNSSYYSNTTILTQEANYRWMITPEMLQNTAGIWYVDAALYNSTWREGLTVLVSSFMSQCYFWDVQNETWDTVGCRVGEKTTAMQTHCQCNHLTLFGSSFFVMPNYVDVSRTAQLFATVNENFVVLALLCAFFGLYLVTLIWAIYSDRRARSRRKMTLLTDSHPGAQYNYLVSVQTGHRKNAGTTATVMVTLIGSEAASDTHHLTDPDKTVCERGNVDIFVLAVPFPLGEVQNVRLQHDNTGGHPSWYINKVTVQDLQTRLVYHFFCGCWLSTDRGDGMIKKTFNAAKNNEVASFRNIFQTRTSTGFRDEHIWVSIVDPPSRSPFTRAQRVSCCMSLLLCTMAINIAFWNIPIDSSSPVLFSIGSLKITWQEIMVGVESGLLMFPINILIITIFRSIKPRMISKSEKSSTEEILRPQSVSIPTILKETEEVISLVSRSPRNRMSEMKRLESVSDLDFALDRLHDLILLIQGESESGPHWVYCSKFLLVSLCHLLTSLEKMDAKWFLNEKEYQHLLNTTNILVHKAEMVYCSHLAYSPPPVMPKRRGSSDCWLPWWCVFLGWFLLLSISAISTYFTLLYGFDYGRDKSIKWVMSLGLSLFQSIFILQPLKVIGIAIFFALLLKPVAVEESEEVEQVLRKQQERCRRYTGRDSL
ncbi:polycystin-1-like protein 2 [Synchiropus picturatus]